MTEGTDDADRLAGLIASQRTFYDLRAPDFGDEAVPDRRVSGYIPIELARALVDEFAPTGDVLELACGSGSFTRELVRHARTVTAVDGSPRMLERNGREVDDSRVTYVDADIFDWQPERRYDAVLLRLLAVARTAGHLRRVLGSRPVIPSDRRPRRVRRRRRSGHDER